MATSGAVAQIADPCFVFLRGQFPTVVTRIEQLARAARVSRIPHSAALGSTPVEGIEITKPPWMFWWPFVDRNPNRWWRRRPIGMIVASVTVVVLIALTILMAITPTQTHL
jgi:hypothetical protein